MYSEINEKIEVLRQGIARLQKIDLIINQLQLEHDSLLQKEKELKAILEKENRDLTKIENKNIASTFYLIVGSLDKHIEKEQREALAAKLKYDQAITDKEDVEYRLSKLSSERTEYSNCQTEYDSIFVNKKELLMRENAGTAQYILKLTEKRDSLRIRVKETQEAIFAGNSVVDSLESVLSSLDRASGWGTWDILGGGLISDLEKHSNIDVAKYKIENTHQLLRDFNAELADVEIGSDLNIRIDGFSKFADFFFDGLFADLNMQEMIGHSQNKVRTVENQVLSVINDLKNMEASDGIRIDELISEINALVESA